MKGLLAFACFSWILSLFFVPSLAQPYKAVNLGAWLVAEGWMTPWLFDGIPNKDLLDGTQVQLRSTMLNKYVAAENGGGSNLVANRASASGWETFKLWRVNETSFNLRVFGNQFVGYQGSSVVAVATTPGPVQTFQIVRNSNDKFRVRLRASNGRYLQAVSESAVTADYQGNANDWGDQNPSVFEMKILRGNLQGEYQLTNGYGPTKAPQVMKNHWNTYIVEDDFRFLSQNGINAVRIPVGWWIRYDQSPPKPFVGGSLQALDNAFTWAEKYNMKVIVDLHAVRGSQNGNDHSATRDGSATWGDSNIDETVAVIDFLTQRRGLAAMELMNEPNAQFVPLDTLKTFYRKGYDAVRKYTANAYVILSNRLGNAPNTELLDFARPLPKTVIDVHYYNLYWNEFSNWSPQQNIDYIYQDRAAKLGELTQPNGNPLTFVGEWVAEFAKGGASTQDYQNYAKAQQDVYGRATFGWAYWSYKCQYEHWSLRRMIENGIIKP
nr:probable glucan 1,3-beta-glucosidase A [Ipomoea batatas]